MVYRRVVCGGSFAALCVVVSLTARADPPDCTGKYPGNDPTSPCKIKSWFGLPTGAQSCSDVKTPAPAPGQPDSCAGTVTWHVTDVNPNATSNFECLSEAGPSKTKSCQPLIVPVCVPMGSGGVYCMPVPDQTYCNVEYKCGRNPFGECDRVQPGTPLKRIYFIEPAFGCKRVDPPPPPPGP